MDDNFFTRREPLISHAPPAGFSNVHDGIYVEIQDKDGNVEQEWLCSPIAVVAMGRNVDHRGWSRCIELTDPDGVLHQWFIPERELTTGFNKVLAGLRDRGLKLASGGSARKSMQDLLTRWEPVNRYVSTDRLGWADTSNTAFVLGNKRVIGNDNTIFLNDAAPDGAPEMAQQGTLDEWRNGVTSLCAGNPILITSVSLAFAGPLLELLGTESAGMHLRGGSSSGKTTAMGAAVSVWGSPKLMHSWRATANALEGVAATCNSSLLALDELGQVSGRDAGDAIYTLANGQGKARSTSVGKLQQTAKWRLMLLSTGEISLADKMAEVGKSPMTGQDVRLIDIAADTRLHGVFDDLHGAVDGASFANSIKSNTAKCYGVAGPAFVEQLISHSSQHATYSEVISKIVSNWKARLDISGDGPAERVLGHFALIAMAGHLATNFGITGWQPGTATSAAFKLMSDWHEAQDRSEKWQIEAAVLRTRNYLKLYGTSSFETRGSPPSLNRVGYRDDKWFYILGDTWNMIHAGLSGADEANHLIAGKWLAKGDGKNLKSKTPSWVAGRPRAYKIRADILAPTPSSSAKLDAA